ncbi:hypothetical protein RB195_024213 [Necator americanus]|uniref:Reverse transcriptase domain-containing protein n=1 Tax=Necator americanus TaxID=51031 RepID=A0ABR1EMG3_NECAM
MDNIDDEYDRLVEHLHDCRRNAKSSKTTKRCLSPEPLALIRQRGAARAAGNHELKSKLARAEMFAKVAETGQSVRYTRWNFANRKAKMTALRTQMEQLHHLFDSQENGHVLPEVLHREVRHAIISVKNRTSLGPDRIKPEHPKYLPPVLINTLARLFTLNLLPCKVQWNGKPARPCRVFKRD